MLMPTSHLPMPLMQLEDVKHVLLHAMPPLMQQLQTAQMVAQLLVSERSSILSATSLLVVGEVEYFSLKMLVLKILPLLLIMHMTRMHPQNESKMMLTLFVGVWMLNSSQEPC